MHDFHKYLESSDKHIMLPIVFAYLSGIYNYLLWWNKQATLIVRFYLQFAEHDFALWNRMCTDK
jgi:hypothetical protein